MTPTSDNGFILTGTVFESEKNIDCWVMKFNHLGSIEWYNKFGSGLKDEIPYASIQMKDKGYIICGEQKDRRKKKSQAWILKIDFRGTKLWEQLYGDEGNNASYSAYSTTDNQFVVAGKQYVDATQNEDAWISMCNKTGEVLWETTYGSTYNDAVYSIIRTKDSGFAASGKRVIDSQRHADFWIIKMGERGELVWDRSFGGMGDDSAIQIFQMNDLGYTFWGNMVDFDTNKQDTWIVKLSSEGYIEWEKTIGGFGAEVASSIFHTKDDGFLICGESIFSSQVNSNFWILKLNQNGDIEFDREFVGPGQKVLGLITQVKDGSYVLSGFDESKTSFERDLFVLKFKRTVNAEDSLFAQISDYITSDYVGGMFLPLRREREYHFEPVVYLTDQTKQVIHKEEHQPLTLSVKNKYFDQTYQYQYHTEAKSIKEFNQPGVYREVPVIRYYGRYGALFPGLSTRYIDKYVNNYTVRLMPRYTPRFTSPYAAYKEIYEIYPKGHEDVPVDVVNQSQFTWKQKSQFSSKFFYSPGSSSPREVTRKQQVPFRLPEYKISAPMLVPMIFLWLVILAAIIIKILFSMKK